MMCGGIPLQGKGFWKPQSAFLRADQLDFIDPSVMPTVGQSNQGFATVF